MSAEATNSGETCPSDNFYREAMEVLQKERIPFLTGGAYAFGVYTGIHRNTKDFDLFLRRDDFDRALEILGRRGFESEKTFPHWLGKVKSGENCIDLIYRAGNGLCEVDWKHLLKRFGSHWRVLLSHIVLFGYIYPSERGRIPCAIIDELLQRWRDESSFSATDRVCQGTLLSREQYLPDIYERGFRDARLEGPDRLAPNDIEHWTDAIG